MIKCSFGKLYNVSGTNSSTIYVACNVPLESYITQPTTTTSSEAPTTSTTSTTITAASTATPAPSTSTLSIGRSTAPTIFGADKGEHKQDRQRHHHRNKKERGKKEGVVILGSKNKKRKKSKVSLVEPNEENDDISFSSNNNGFIVMEGKSSNVLQETNTKQTEKGSNKKDILQVARPTTVKKKPKMHQPITLKPMTYRPKVKTMTLQPVNQPKQKPSKQHIAKKTSGRLKYSVFFLFPAKLVLFVIMLICLT